MAEQEQIVDSLRATMLRCLLDGEPFPGADRAVRFPDFGFISESETPTIASDHLSDEFPFENEQSSPTVRSEREIRALANAEGDRFYVYFPPARWDDERVRIVLEVRLAPEQTDVRQLTLGGVSAMFVQSEGEWIVAEEPAVMAT